MLFFDSAGLLGRKNLAIDLGTANTVIHLDGAGIVVDEPSVVAIDHSTGMRTFIAVGEAAKQMLGRTPSNIEVVRPIRDGVVADIEVAEEMLKHFMRKAIGAKRSLRAPKVVICVPSGATSVERRAIRDAALNAGASHVTLIEEPFAAALGAGLMSGRPEGAMIVDIGGGTTELGIVSMGALVTSASLRVGGSKIDDAIISYVRRRYNFAIGETTAEFIKISHGNALAPSEGEGAKFSVLGKNLKHGGPSPLELNELDVHEAIKEVLSMIVSGILAILEAAPPELSADIFSSGIVITGGGSLLPGLTTLIESVTGLTVSRADAPLLSVANGARSLLEMKPMELA